MSKQKRSKLTATATLGKTRQEKPLVQAEGKLTEAQLEAIAGGTGGCGILGCLGNHNETMVSSAQLNLEGDTHV